MYGGGEVLAAWILQALRGEHSLSILAWEQLHLQEINRVCATSLTAADYALIRPRALLRGIGRLGAVMRIDPHRSHRYGQLMRLARGLRDRHDLVIAPFNEADLGGGGIQYVHEPWTQWLEHPTLGRRLTGLGLGARAFRHVHGYSAERMRTNLTLTNSAWSAGQVERALRVPATVVWPPAPGRSRALPWEQREHAFIAVGRLVPPKRLDEIIEILARLREAGSGLRLHIAGRPGDTPRDRRYLRSLRARVATTDWLTLHEDLPREGLLELLGQVRYGIHAYREEPFGIAVAEMVRAGAIPFAHNSGGVREIVGAEELLYASHEEAVEKVLAVIGSEEEQRRLRQELAGRAEQFSEEVFVRRIREVVRAHAASQHTVAMAQPPAADRGLTPPPR